mmetsp:Transcript_10116/g.9070  ORF Transcript_10116/g.9070 Transcript_10116/m.9070 type:complete len:173 (+) Transcript_10116:42-560(+)
MRNRKSYNPRSKRRSLQELRSRNDFIRGRYFIFTLLYGLTLFGGAFAGFAKVRSLVCLLVSGVIGLFLIVLSIGHGIDYYRPGVMIESFYVVIPLVISISLASYSICHYLLSGIWMPSGVLSYLTGIATIFYLYAVIKDFASGETYVQNRYRELSTQGDGEVLFDLSKTVIN